jgi:filamentous hemagglutinin family protein
MKNTNTHFANRSAKTVWMRVSLAATMFAFSALLAGAANAGVDVSKITRGDVSFSQDGNRLVVRASNGSIIEYSRFSVEAGQIMQFIQPSATSTVLNRVTGAELSRIDGSLLSNGIVYLVNPQGIRIGNGALINVGGFYAAAGAMSDNDFVRGNNNFTNLSGKVTNEGIIQAKSVALVGQYVANRGTINVDNGMVAMAAGDTVYLQNGSGPIMVTVSRSQMGADGSGAGAQAAVSNTGTINAGSGSVAMASGDFYALAMDLSGTIIGKSIAARGGAGGVVAVNGTLDASSTTGKGGDIDVFGDRVGLFGNALVNANGATSGGSVRIGGDYLGTNAANAPQANRTVMGTDARITANATQSGDGGRVIVWSNEYTGFFGSIQANGAGTGNGGFVETSSHDNLQAFGSVTASSVLGTAGTWLMDPSDVEITIATNTNPGAFVNPWVPTGDSSQISAVDIVNALNGNTSVQIQTNNGAGTQSGNITMAAGASITSTGTATLTLIAAGNINITEAITGTGGGALSVVLGAVGSVTVAAVINTNGGNFTIRGADPTGATLATSAGSAVLSNNITTGAGALSITATGAVNQTAGALVIGGTTSVTTGGAAITLTQAANDFVGAVSLTNTGANAVAITDVNALILGASNTANDLTVITGGGPTGGLTQTGALTVGGTTTITSSAALTNIDLSTQANNFAGTFTLGTPGNVQDFKLRNTNAAAGAIVGLSNTSTPNLRDLTIIYNNAAYEVPNLDMAQITNELRNIEITAGGAITQAAGGIDKSEVTGTASFTTGNFAITLDDPANDFGFFSTVSLNNTGAFDVRLTDSNFMTLATCTIGGNLFLTATNNMGFTGAITVGGDVNIFATGTALINVELGQETGSGQFNILNSDFALLTAVGNLNITATGRMTVNGVSLGGTIGGITTLTASGTFPIGVTFSGASSNFNNALTVASVATIAGVNITTAGNMTFANTATVTTAAVSLNSTGGNILFNNTLTGGNQNLTVLASGNVTFNNTVGGTDTTTQFANLTVDCGNDPGETITFGTAAATVRAVAVNLNTNTLLATPPNIATIAAISNISFANTTFAMGQNEKLTSLGGIRINGLTGLTSNATSVTLGDVNAVGNLRVTSPSITLLARASGPITTNTGGTITDPMVAYIVGGQVFFSTTPVMGGSGTEAVFSNPTGNVDGSGTLGNFAQSIYQVPINVALLTGTTGQILDLTPSGSVGFGNPALIIPQPIPLLPPVGLLGNSDTLDQDSADDSTTGNSKNTGKPTNSNANKTASDKPAVPAVVPVASR